MPFAKAFGMRILFDDPFVTVGHAPGEKVELHEKDLPVVATHEAGHFLVSIFCPHHAPPEKVTIQSNMPWAPFFTQFKHEKKRIGMSRSEMLDILTVLGELGDAD